MRKSIECRKMTIAMGFVLGITVVVIVLACLRLILYWSISIAVWAIASAIWVFFALRTRNAKEI